MAPAHPHATWVAMYPALFHFIEQGLARICGRIFLRIIWIFSRVLRSSTPCFVGPSIGLSVTLLFLFFCGFWPHYSSQNDLVTSITAPAHPHATGVAMYPALLII